MAEGKKSFVLYTDLIDLLDGDEDTPPMSDEDAGLLFKTILRYVNDLNPVIPQSISQAFTFIKKQLKIDLKKYEAQCERINRINEERKRKKEEQCRNDIDTKSIRNRDNIDNETQVVENDVDSDNCNLIIDNCNLINEISKDINITTCSKEQRTGGSKEALFELFWDAYPRKVGKQKCLNWFKKSKLITKEFVDSMIKAIQEQKESKQWTKDNGSFIPHPYTWLNRGGWNDELGNVYELEASAKANIIWEEA